MAKEIKISEMNTWARGNGCPAHGDVIETDVDGVLYRTEYYVDGNFGHPVLCTACDADIERLVDGQWEVVTFPNTSDGDDMLNELLNKMYPRLVDDRNLN